MASANDSVIIGSVLALVFGALFYYLYSRIVYSEKRINMMENILLDFKTASESFFVTTPSQGFAAAADQDESNSNHSYVPSGQDATSHVGSAVVEDVASVAADVSKAPLPVAAPAPAPAAPEPTATTQTAVGMNYESMNIKELQQEARKRNVPGTKRKELIQNLRAADNANASKTDNNVFLQHDELVESLEPIDNNTSNQ